MRSDYCLKWIGDREARAALEAMVPREDMAAQLEGADWAIPAGPKWVLYMRHGLPYGMGGFQPAGAGTSLGWLLVTEMGLRDWAAARWAIRVALDWAGRHAIRRIHALVANDQPKHAALLARLGFKLTGQEGDNAVMTLELK